MGKTKRVRLVLEWREDGGLRVYSPDVRGLVLSHNDPAKVMADVIPVLDVLLSRVTDEDGTAYASDELKWRG